MEGEKRTFEDLFTDLQNEMQLCQNECDYIDSYEAISAQVDADAALIDEWTADGSKEGFEQAKELLIKRLESYLHQVLLN